MQDLEPKPLILECSGLSIYRRGKPVLESFDLSFFQDCLLIEGEESRTLLEVFTGWRAYRGDVKIFGLAPGSNLLLDKITYRSTADDWPAYSTVEEWLALSASERSSRDLFLEKAKNIADGLRLPWKSLIKHLRKRERSALAIAESLLSKAGLLLLDQPFDGMDKEDVVKSLGWLKGRRGVIIATPYADPRLSEGLGCIRLPRVITS